MRILRVWWALLLAMVCTGCGSSKPVAPPPSGPSMVKSILQDLANTGQINSGIEELQRQLEAMKATDPGKATALLADYKELRSLSKPQAIKTKAKAMIDKL